MPDESFSQENLVRPSEGEIIQNSYPDALYSHDFNGGKYFSLISEERGGDFEMQISQRVKFQVSFINDRDDINGLTIQKFKYRGGEWLEDENEKITLSQFNFQKLTSFLQFLSEINLKSISERRIRLIDDSLQDIDQETKQKIQTLLLTESGKNLIEELLTNGSIDSRDLVNVGYRKQQVRIFERLLIEDDFINEYATQNSIPVSQKEKVWQYFFQKNKWIFGYGLDYRFLDIIQREASISGTDLAGRGQEFADFLTGCENFTVLVELKRPDTNLFGPDSNRSGCWKLSNDLIGAVSQILEQKASWQIESEGDNNFDTNGDPIIQKTFDPKTILIIGNTSQFAGDNRENRTKAKTFELFRRDSRNIEILTYDEVYKRAKYLIDSQEDNTN